MRYFPIFCDMQGRMVLIAGGGDVAANKVRLFAKTPARIRVVAEALNDEIAALVEQGRVEHVADDPSSAEFGSALLVIAATESDADIAIAERAAREGYLVNAVDKTELCAFITPSIVDRGKIVVAIGTEGAAPVLARRTRERIEALLPERLGELAEFIGRNRERLARLLPETPGRRAFWEDVVDGPIGAALLGGDSGGAQASLDDAFAALAESGRGQGRGSDVARLAAPPEDDLLTLRDLRLLQDADIIFHETEVSEGVLDKARRDAARVSFSGPGGMPEAAAIEKALDEGKRIVVLLTPETAKNADILPQNSR